MSRKTTGIPRVTPVQRGMIAFLKRDYPRAFESFLTAYQSPKWQLRDAAVTAMGDMIDPRIIEHQKKPSIILVANWEPPRVLSGHRLAISDDRMMVLLETFFQPSQWKPHNIIEYKTLKTLSATVELLQQILLSDAHYLVRFSTLLVLTEMIGEDKRHFISQTLHRAHRQEQDALLKAAIAEFLPQRSS